MKTYIIIIVFVVGFMSWITGFLFKVQSWPNASLYLTIGTVIILLACLLFIIKLLIENLGKDNS